MKTFKNLLQLLLISLVVFSCSKDYDEPPLNEPHYTGNPANITIAQLKEVYKDVGEDPKIIETDYIVKGYVTGNDISGNIFKQIFVQDNTGALCIGVDQANLNSLYPIGQEVYIKLHGLAILRYGGELQIGFAGTNANRIPWGDFEERVLKNGWPDKTKVVPTVADMANLTDDMVNTLVTFEKVYFVKGGKALFTDDKGNQILNTLDGASNLTVRSSAYSAQFGKLELPYGTGTVSGILGRHNGGWQLTLRSIDDIGEFDGKEPEVIKPEGDVFYETFGDGANKEKVAAWTGWLEKAPIAYADASGVADVRALAGNSHLWMPKSVDSYLTITGINTAGKSDLVLTYDAAASVFNEGETVDLGKIEVKVNGVSLTTQSKVVVGKADNNKFFKMEIANFPISDNVTLEFFAPGAANQFGFRLDNIKIAKADGTIVPNP